MIKKKVVSTRGHIHYWISDSKETTILFLHGLTADHRLFDQQVDELSKDYQLILVDLPLHGQSRRYNDFSFDHVSEDLKSILDKENIEQVVIVGQSAGGYFSQSFVKSYPDYVKGFVGIGTTPFGSIYYKTSDLFWIRHFAFLASLYPYKTYCRLSAKSVGLNKQTQDSMLETLMDLGKKDMLNAVKSVYGAFLDEENEVEFNCPVLITYGQYDKTGYVSKYNDEWANAKGHALKLIPDASHNANYDNPKYFNTILKEFITTLA